MIQCVVIADDLTGANATGVMLKKLNLKTISIMNMEKVDLESLTGYDAVTISTESRAIDPGLAYDRVHKAAGLMKGPSVKLYNKRIDSTLRGNLGAEIDGLLDGLGDDRIAIVVPVFPQAGRMAAGGYLLVNGVMLQKTDAARDPKNPIHTSVIDTLVKKQTRYKVHSIFLDKVYSGMESLKREIVRAHSEGCRVLLFDGIHVEDLETIAEAVIESGIPFVTIDPGPMTAVTAGKLMALERSRTEAKILMAVGSISSLTKMQVEEVERAYHPMTVEVEAVRLLDGDHRQAEMDRVAGSVLKALEKHSLFCIVTNSIHPENRIDMAGMAARTYITEEELSLRLNDGIAEITHRILSQAPDFGGVFSSGGDITVAVCKRCNASGLSLFQEVIPLAAYGKLEGGDFPGLRIITKGGMVGDKDAMKTCVHFMKEQLSASFK